VKVKGVLDGGLSGGRGAGDDEVEGGGGYPVNGPWKFLASQDGDRLID